ncbi:MAG: hypothetical protein SFY66_01730 [Oculatellaceae cyanobacterium bins.114]|nr:hypothetical protein [Oculatellaceae cyanobacterium bins.114]
MTLETFFTDYRIPIILLMLVTPWMTYLLCYFIPTQREEPFILSVNLWLSVVSMLFLAGYLAYITNTGGWEQLVKQADVFLLILPPYHLITSVWLSRQRLPLEMIPAFRTLQGLVLMGGIYLVFSWLASRIYIVFFSYMPFNSFLLILAVLLGIGYLGYRKVFD